MKGPKTKQVTVYADADTYLRIERFKKANRAACPSDSVFGKAAFKAFLDAADRGLITTNLELREGRAR